MKRTLIVLVLAAVWLSGCGSRETNVQRGNRDQVLHLANGVEPEDLDPHVTASLYCYIIYQALFEPLVMLDPVDLAPIPGLARSWAVSEDHKTYTFHLREEALFSNGDPITAGDLERSIQRVLTPLVGFQYTVDIFHVEGAEAYYRGETKDFSSVGVKAIGPHTLEVRLTRPLPFALPLFSMPYWAPLHIPTLEKFGSLERPGTTWTRPGNHVGNGPFRLKEWRVNQMVVAEKNPHYWGRDAVTLNEVRFYVSEDISTEERMFRTGQVHATTRLPAGKVEEYRQSRPESFRSSSSLSTSFLIPNTKHPALKDPRVRQALAMSLDRPTITRVLRTGHRPAYNMLPPGIGGYTSPVHFKDDAEAARRLLAEAGYPGGNGFPRITLSFAKGLDMPIVEMIQEMWRKELNLEVTAESSEWKVYLVKLQMGAFDVGMLGWSAFNDPFPFHNMLVTGNPFNYSGWSHSEYDALRERSLSEPLEENRFPILHRMDELMRDEMPVIPLYYYTENFAVHPSVEGWQLNLMNLQDFKRIRLREP